MGRSPKLTKHQLQEVLARLARGEQTLVSRAVDYSWANLA
jgi:hypothetical protein